MYITHIQYLTISVIYQILNLKGSGVSGELMIKQGVFRHPPSFIPTLPRGCCRRCGSLRVCQMVRRLRRSSPLHQAAVSRVSTRPPTTSTAMDLSSSGLVPLVGGPFLSFFLCCISDNQVLKVFKHFFLYQHCLILRHFRIHIDYMTSICSFWSWHYDLQRTGVWCVL